MSLNSEVMNPVLSGHIMTLFKNKFNVKSVPKVITKTEWDCDGKNNKNITIGVLSSTDINGILYPNFRYLITKREVSTKTQDIIDALIFIHYCNSGSSGKIILERYSNIYYVA